MVWEACPPYESEYDFHDHPSILTDGAGEHFAHIQVVAPPGTAFRTGAWLSSPIPSNDFTEIGTLDAIPSGPDGLPLGLVTPSIVLCETAWKETYQTTGTWKPLTTNKHYKYMEHLFRMGPKIFIIQLMITWTYYSSPEATYPVFPFPVYPAGGWSSWSGVSFSVLSALDRIGLLEETIALGQEYSNLDPESIYLGEHGDPIPYPGFKLCPAAVDALLWLSTSFYESWYSFGFDGHPMNPSTLKIYTRPHTKEELQAAGMWPVA